MKIILTKQEKKVLEMLKKGDYKSPCKKGCYNCEHGRSSKYLICRIATFFPVSYIIDILSMSEVEK